MLLASTSTPCAIRAAPRTSGRRCGSNTPEGTAGRPSPQWTWRTVATPPAPPPPISWRRRSWGAPDQWWQQQVVAGLHRVGTDSTRIAELMTSYFELTELHIHPRTQGRGLGEALTRRLLAGRRESHVLLSTPEINGESNRAWRLYRRLGFTDIIRGYHFAGDPRPFAILGRSLPL